MPSPGFAESSCPAVMIVIDPELDVDGTGALLRLAKLADENMTPPWSRTAWIGPTR